MYRFFFLLPLTAIVWRFLYRGYHYAGWEIHETIQSIATIENIGIWGAINRSFYSIRHCWNCSRMSGVMLSINNLLNYIMPWEFWQHAMSLLSSILVFWLLGILLKLKKGQWVWLILAVGCSSTLLSLSTIGDCYTGAMIPHILALFFVFHPTLKKRPILKLFLGLLLIEYSWHVYTIGRTILIPFILASFLQTESTSENRYINLFIGILATYLVLIGNNGKEVALWGKFDNILPITLENFYAVTKAITFDPGMDLPIIIVLGIGSLFFIRTDRLLFAGLLLSQLALVYQLGFHGIIQLKPRRFVLVDFYSVVIILTVVKQWLPDINKKVVKCFLYVLFSVLIVGNIWQFVDLKKYTSTDIHAQEFGLPYTFSHNDYKIRPGFEDTAMAIANHVKNGKKIILVYNYKVYIENPYNPEKLPGRIMLRIGYKKFKDNILMFSDKQNKLNRVPYIDISDINITLKSLNDLDNYLVFEYVPQKHDTKYKPEHSEIMKALKSLFVLKELEKIDNFNIYTI